VLWFYFKLLFGVFNSTDNIHVLHVHTSNIRRRQGTTQAGSHQWKLLDYIKGAIIFILVFHFSNFPFNSELVEREAVYSSTLPRQHQQPPSDSYYQEPPPPRINPWDSQPPKPIALLDTNSPAVRQRHECIQAIRKRLKFFDTKNEFFTTTSIGLLSLGKVVVCGCFHAAILCYLVGLPFVYIDQVSGKITQTLGEAFDGMKDCQGGEKDMLAKASTLDEAAKGSAEFIDNSQLEMGGEFQSGLRTLRRNIVAYFG
jgi:hypothetical protein